MCTYVRHISHGSYVLQSHPFVHTKPTYGKSYYKQAYATVGVVGKCLNVLFITNSISVN